MRHRRAATAVFAATALIALACSSGNSDETSSTPDKYKQTWAKRYSDTTCTDWTGEMTEKQRWVAAADMLTGARKKDGDDGLPEDSMVDTFQGGITNACSSALAKSQPLTGIGAALYLTEKAKFGPAAG